MIRSGRLDGRNGVIVGGTGGIGRATSKRFLEEGARLVLTGKDPSEVAQTIEALQDLGPVWGETVDVAEEHSVVQLFGRAVEQLGGRLDFLVHIAGISGRRFGDGPLHECTVEGWDTVQNVNARGVFLSNREAVRQMLTQPIDDAGLRGTVLNLGSALGWSPSPTYFGTIAYAASKGALQALTLASAAKYAPQRIRFNLLAPGLIATPMANRALNDPKILSYLAAKQPMAGGPGTAEDVAELALVLCEPATKFVTGTIVPVDGGWCVSEGQGGGSESV